MSSNVWDGGEVAHWLRDHDAMMRQVAKTADIINKNGRDLAPVFEQANRMKHLLKRLPVEEMIAATTVNARLVGQLPVEKMIAATSVNARLFGQLPLSPIAQLIKGIPPPDKLSAILAGIAPTLEFLNNATAERVAWLEDSVKVVLTEEELEATGPVDRGQAIRLAVLLFVAWWGSFNVGLKYQTAGLAAASDEAFAVFMGLFVFALWALRPNQSG